MYMFFPVGPLRGLKFDDIGIVVCYGAHIGSDRLISILTLLLHLQVFMALASDNLASLLLLKCSIELKAYFTNIGERAVSGDVSVVVVSDIGLSAEDS